MRIKVSFEIERLDEAIDKKEYLAELKAELEKPISELLVSIEEHATEDFEMQNFKVQKVK